MNREVFLVIVTYYDTFSSETSIKGVYSTRELAVDRIAHLASQSKVVVSEQNGYVQEATAGLHRAEYTISKRDLDKPFPY